MLLVKFLSAIFAAIPDPVVMRLAQVAFPLFHRLAKKGKWGLRYSTILPKVFPDRGEKWHRKVVRENTLHLLRLAGELLKAHYKTRRGVDRKCYIKEGEEYFHECLDSGEGFVIMTCHLGNWEYSAEYLSLNYRRLHAPVFVEDSSGNKALNWMREGRSVTILETGYDTRRSAKTLLTMIDVLKKGGIVFLVADQEAFAGEYRGTLFGKELRVFGGPFILGQKTGVRILPHYNYREKNGRLALCFDPPFSLNGKDLTGDIGMVMDFFEKCIGAHPDQYIWSQDRW
jgi:lauroyl/myristoyl acyltransferase